MPTVLMIRHGESAANAGHATSDPSMIPLTMLGHEQAMAVSLAWEHAPDLIVSSPFLRARQTTQPTTERFPHVPMEVWPVHEFTYLSPARCAGTTQAERRAWVEDYWQRADPDWRDGEGAESFRELMQRVDSCLSALRQRADQTVLIFGHGQFMQAMLWRQANPSAAIDAMNMRAFRVEDSQHSIYNAQMLLMRLSSPTRRNE